MFRALLIALIAGATGFAFWQWTPDSLNPASNQTAASAAGQKNAAKPRIQLMTSLPIVWGQGASMEDILSGDSEPAAIYRHWQNVYDIEPVDSFEGLKDSKTDIVILAQPPAMAPADIADFDGWVRGGGRAVILTDPMLVWSTDLPIGDNRRPLAVSLLSPLLGHWDLELRAPEQISDVEMQIGGFTIDTIGVGSFHSPDRSGAAPAVCNYSAEKVIAECRVGGGHVTLIADADFIDERLWRQSPALDSKQASDAARLVDAMIADLRDAS